MSLILRRSRANDRESAYVITSRPEHRISSVLTRCKNETSVICGAASYLAHTVQSYRMTEKFHWDLSGLSKPRFVALTNLLSLRNIGGQLERVDDPFNELPDQDSADNASTDDTNRPDILSPSGYDEYLKRCFLDGFAELVACETAATQHDVSCAVMQEEEDMTQIWVAHNEGFQETDKAFFRKFELLWGQIALYGRGTFSSVYSNGHR